MCDQVVFNGHIVRASCNMTGAELRDIYKQGLYYNLRESMESAHIAIASGSVNPDVVMEEELAIPLNAALVGDNKMSDLLDERR